MQLNKKERALVQEMYATKRELKCEASIQAFQEHWMEHSVAGEIDRRQVELQMEEAGKEDKEFELRHLTFEPLDGYTPDKREQVIYNMDTNERCYVEHDIVNKANAPSLRSVPYKC